VSFKKAARVAPAVILLASSVVPRLLRISDAAKYLSCTFGFVETLVRERTIPVLVLGKRHSLDVHDLDDYIDQKKAEAA